MEIFENTPSGELTVFQNAYILYYLSILSMQYYPMFGLTSAMTVKYPKEHAALVNKSAWGTFSVPKAPPNNQPVLLVHATIAQRDIWKGSVVDFQKSASSFAWANACSKASVAFVVRLMTDHAQEKKDLVHLAEHSWEGFRGVLTAWVLETSATSERYEYLLAFYDIQTLSS